MKFEYFELGVIGYGLWVWELLYFPDIG
jgi:hypothetical protein